MAITEHRENTNTSFLRETPAPSGENELKPNLLRRLFQREETKEKYGQHSQLSLGKEHTKDREDAIICPYYLKTGTCKYGPTCKFDHPPPGEVMAKAAIQSTHGKEGEEKMYESVHEEQQ